jgi:hypothetical protein
MDPQFEKGFIAKVEQDEDTEKYRLVLNWYDHDAVDEVVLPQEFDSLEEAMVSANHISNDVIQSWGDLEDFDSPDDADIDGIPQALAILLKFAKEYKNVDIQGIKRTHIPEELLEAFGDISDDYISGLLFGLPMAVAALPYLDDTNLGELKYLGCLASLLQGLLALRKAG